MKKVILLLSLFFCIGLGFGNLTLAKEPTYDELKNQIKVLQAENKKLKESNPGIQSGTIYTNGVKNTVSNFVTVNGKHYFEINNIIPSLTRYTSQQISFDANKKELYLGIKPIKGVISLTDLKYFESGLALTDNKSFSINNQKFSKNVYGLRDISYKLHGNYSSLQFFYGASDLALSGTDGEIIILGDGNELFNSGELEIQEDPIYAEVDVKGVKKLTIKFTNNAGLGNPTLSPK